MAGEHFWYADVLEGLRLTQDSTARWKQIDCSVLRTIALSIGARELAHEDWPGWAKRSTQVRRILAIRSPTDAHSSATGSSSRMLAVLLTERIDPKDRPKYYNNNFYLTAESSDGRIFQSGPIVPTSTDPAHHSSSPSTWFDGLA